MTNKYIQPGDQITVTAAGAVTQGTIYVGTDRAGVYLETGVTGDLVPVAVEGVFEVTKNAGASDAWTVFDKIYAATGGAECTATGGTPMGVAVEAAVTGATTGKIKLAGW